MSVRELRHNLRCYRIAYVVLTATLAIMSAFDGSWAFVVVWGVLAAWEAIHLARDWDA